MRTACSASPIHFTYPSKNTRQFKWSTSKNIDQKEDRLIRMIESVRSAQSIKLEHRSKSYLLYLYAMINIFWALLREEDPEMLIGTYTLIQYMHNDHKPKDKNIG